jgi:hypothetical protein
MISWGIIAEEPLIVKRKGTDRVPRWENREITE